MGSLNKVIHINMSGATWPQIHRMVDAGHLPTVSKLVNAGCIGNLWAPAPLHRPVPAVSMATGVHPDQHKCWSGFMPDKDYGARPLRSDDIAAPMLWEIAAAQGARACAIGWPGTHPVHTSKSLLISDGFVIPRGAAFEDWPINPASVSDASLLDDLAEARLHPSEIEAEMIAPFLPDFAKIDQETDTRLSMFMQILSRAVSAHGAATWAAERQAWDMLTVHFDLIEHLSAAFLQYQAPRMGHVSQTDHALYGGVVDGAYHFMDMLLARYLELLPEGGHLILTSDHGFEVGAQRTRVAANIADQVTGLYRDFGVFLVHGPKAVPDGSVAGITLFDIAPTVLSLMGLKLPDGMPGKVAQGAFSEPLPATAYKDGKQKTAKEPPPLDPVWASKMMEEAAALGYLRIGKIPKDQLQSAVCFENRLHKAMALGARRQFAPAITALDAALELSPSSPRALPMKTRYALALGDIETAKESFAILQAADPFAAGNAALAGEIAAAQGDLAQALALFATASEDVPLGPAGVHHLVRIGHGQRRAGDPVAAEASFRAALKRRPDNADALRGLGQALEAQDRFGEAVTVLGQSLGQKFIQPEAQVVLARCHLAQADLDEAERAAQAALETLPEFEPAQQIIARVAKLRAKATIQSAKGARP
jgi:predicted AlkP superfamily phosphohydrolase/phosphomutase/tetratricopeptide (TPR) repeat protein